MPMLILMRHGEARLPVGFLPQSDEKRTLTEKGKYQVVAQTRNAAIAWENLHQVWVSPFVRTQQTYRLLQETFSEQITDSWQLTTNTLITPNGKPAKVQECLLASSLVDSLLITHQPLISQLIGFFVHGDIYAGEPMYEASVAVLEGDVFASGCMELKILAHV